MRKFVKGILLGIGIFTLMGCVENTNNTIIDKNVGENSEGSKYLQSESYELENAKLGGKDIGISDTLLENTTDSEGVDYDLTEMGEDMVYATVYQMMMEPDAYIGKTVKMRGIYNSVWYEPTQQYYQYVIIEDAMACCAQGIEFIWEDGSHIYPEEYPEQGEYIEVVGIFETYKEDNDENLYCRLNNSTMEIVPTSD